MLLVVEGVANSVPGWMSVVVGTWGWEGRCGGQGLFGVGGGGVD